MRAPTARAPVGLSSTTPDGVGASPRRPDGTLKVTGEFAYSSDMWMEDMLWGATLRSPHPHARILGIDTTGAVKLPGVHAVLTHEDVPGEKRYGLEYRDQPVLAFGKVRYKGEPVAIVAADHPETARRALERIRVDYEVLDPVSDSRAAAFDPDCPLVHEEGSLPLHEEYNQRGNVVRHQPIRTGAFASGASVAELRARADVVVSSDYEVGMQDQAFLGPESGMAVPAEDGGVDLYIATQWLHVDQRQIAPALGLPQEKVRLTLAGVGGAFGAREDLSMQIHACMLALRTGRPVKIVYNREESFYGHVHRHPARMRYEHGAKSDGTLLYAVLEIIVDGGAYASATPAVVGVASSLGIGPYEVPNVSVDAYGVYTTNPPCGAMRGFGAVQVCFAHEAQMDKLAAALGMDPVSLPLRNTLEPGDELITGQVITGTAPVREVIEAAVAHHLPVETGPAAADDTMLLPGGAGLTAERDDVRRGVGFAVGFKNLMYSEGYDDASSAAVRLEVGADGAPLATVYCAAAEVGQGFVTLAQQIVRSELGVDHVLLRQADTAIGSAGSTSASRQTWMSGGAVQLAAQAVREALEERAARRDASVDVVALVDLLADGPVEEVRTHHHAPTDRLDERGQGSAHVSFAFAAHRAVVDVDPELGLVRVVQIATGQDVGRALNPRSVVGQIEGGIAQGLGLAVMEEIVVDDGVIRNPSFTDYLIPTALDMPVVAATLIEQPEPGAPFGAKGVGEPPTISSTPAIVAAIRAATGLDLTRVPVRPQDIALAGRTP